MTQKEFCQTMGLVVGSMVLCTGGIILNIMSQQRQLSFKFSGDTQPKHNVAANGDDSSSVTTNTNTESVAALNAAITATKDPTPLYMYKKGEFIQHYDTEIQNMIYEAWSEFPGTLPEYEFVLSLWISESGLDPALVRENTDGTYDFGIPQLNTTTLEECLRRGWMSPEDDIEDPETQIRLGLTVLSYYCENCEGGAWPYYRAIRAYAIGKGGLEYAESIGDYGFGDTYQEGPDGTWYPGKYGEVMATMKFLVDAKS